MKKLALILLATVAMFSCKKNNDIKTTTPDATPKSYSNKIVLDNLNIMGDSLKISWSMLDTSAFLYYSLQRKDYPEEQMLEVKALPLKTQTAVTDNSVPYSAQVQYQVVGYLKSGQKIVSNTVSYNRPDIKTFNVSPFDIQYDKADQTLYFFERGGKISIYSITQKTITKSINTNATIGYSDFGVYNGKKELYVPRNDGWVFIYDAVTLEKIGQVSSGLNNTCVVFNNNNLYISTSAWTNKPIKVYSRQTGNKISEAGDFDRTRFKHVPNSNFDLMEIALYIGPIDQDYYTFSANGTFISHVNDKYHGDYPLDATIFEYFPDGTRYITSSAGAIYNKDMTYQTSLPRGNLLFTSFAISPTDNLIYAGSQSKNIEAYSIANYQHVKTISTKAYPYRVFDLGGNQILSVSSTNNPVPCNGCSTQVKNVIIETLNK